MAGAIIGTAAAAATAVIAFAGHGLGSSPARVPVSPFGGSTAVRIAHVSRIDVALGPAGSAGLRRVRCVGAAAGKACYIGR